MYLYQFWQNKNQAALPKWITPSTISTIGFIACTAIFQLVTGLIALIQMRSAMAYAAFLIGAIQLIMYCLSISTMYDEIEGFFGTERTYAESGIAPFRILCFAQLLTAGMFIIFASRLKRRQHLEIENHQRILSCTLSGTDTLNMPGFLVNTLLHFGLLSLLLQYHEKAFHFIYYHPNEENLHAWWLIFVAIEASMLILSALTLGKGPNANKRYHSVQSLWSLFMVYVVGGATLIVTATDQDADGFTSVSRWFVVVTWIGIAFSMLFTVRVIGAVAIGPGDQETLAEYVFMFFGICLFYLMWVGVLSVAVL